MAEDTAQFGGTFGIASAATELFALGSIFWYMVRGTELWAGVQGLDLVDRLIARTCPDMDLEDPVNRIIRDCWTGRFDSVAALAACIRRLVYSRDLEQKKSLCEQHSKLICG